MLQRGFAAAFSGVPLSNQARKLARQLFSESEQGQAAFVQALENGVGSHRHAVLWTRDRPEEPPFHTEPALPWQPGFVDRLAADQRAGQHPLHDAGHYYCLDMSSVFAASIMTVIQERPRVILDVCASPGGKSVFAWAMFRPDRLIANESIRKRTAQLIANLKRCSIQPAAVISYDTARLAEVCAGAADLVIVDAPCSGQSLIAKGRENPGCFHPATINLNANRQRRILANSARTVAAGGHLAYITCTYAEKENEGNARWLMKQQPGLTPVVVPGLGAHQSHLADFPCYRLWPQEGIGAGAFAVLFKNVNQDHQPARDVLHALRTVWSSSDMVSQTSA
jgi:16S rRNA C967 or C1407 C5-methylase (RsmB/RsmF family)